MRKKISNIILMIAFLVGLSLLLYPTISDYWNSYHQSHIISSYTAQIAELDENDYEEILEAARQYNRSLWEKDNQFYMSEENTEVYEKTLDIFGNGMMGYISIPKINITLPVYHTTSEAVLQVAVGHIEWSSLPVGGESTHTVLSGHRGLPSATLFSNLDKLETGDTFTLQVLDETLTYEVDRILIVEPENVENLRLEPGEDYCTLVTCTPYGVNSHRLLIRGHRVSNAWVAAQVRVSSDAFQINPLYVAPLLAVPIILLMLLFIAVKHSGRHGRSGNMAKEILNDDQTKN